MANNGEIGISFQCISCDWYIGPISEGVACFAFPKGIPRTIIRGLTDHRLPYPGDHGLRWKENPEYIAILNEQEQGA